jgi:hypothetical protein
LTTHIDTLHAHSKASLGRIRGDSPAGVPITSESPAVAGTELKLGETSMTLSNDFSAPVSTESDRPEINARLSRRTMLGIVAASVGGVAISAIPAVGASATTVRKTNSRDALVAGTYCPDATTTGRLTTDQTLVTTDQTYSGTTAAVIENQRFQGYVYLTGSNKTFKNCVFEGPLNPSHASVTATYAGSSNNLFVDCTFKPRGKTDTTDTIIGRGFTLLRCDLSYGVDGLGAAPQAGGTRCDVVVQQCWVHDLLYFSPSNTHPDNQTHNDIIQWHGGAGLTIRGNRLDGFCAPDVGDANRKATYDSNGKQTGGHPFYPNPVSMSVLMVNQQSTLLPSELVMEKNWIDGGAIGINMLGVPTAFPAPASSSITNNWAGYKFGYGQNYFIVGKAAQTYTLTGNHRWNSTNPLDTSVNFNTRLNG